MLRSFVDAQWLLAQRLSAWDVATPVVDDELFDDCLAVGRQLLLQGRLHGPEALSRELFASALRLAGNRGLVQLPDDATPEALVGLATRRREFAEEIHAVVGRVVRIDETDARNRQESTGVRP